MFNLFFKNQNDAFIKYMNIIKTKPILNVFISKYKIFKNFSPFVFI